METISAKHICHFYTKDNWGKQLMNEWLSGIRRKAYSARDVFLAMKDWHNHNYIRERYVSPYDEKVIIETLNRLAAGDFKYRI